MRSVGGVTGDELARIVSLICAAIKFDYDGLALYHTFFSLLCFYRRLFFLTVYFKDIFISIFLAKLETFFTLF